MGLGIQSRGIASVNTPSESLLGDGIGCGIDLEICRSFLDVMGGRVVLSVVVGEILLAWLPMHSELSLLDPISNPKESHVHRFGAFCLDSVVGNSFSCGVIVLDRCGARLRMAHFL